jgi:1,4-dihydroxy-2-naphthoate octaprenyltransferase
MKVVVILGHPRADDTLCAALAKASADGARAAGCDVRLIDLGRMEFNPDVEERSPASQPLEPCLEAARQDIDWANHLILVFPTWWGTFPARLKGFFDRVLLPGRAFEETTSGTGYVGLMKGRTADLIVTMDTPSAIYSLVYGAPGIRAVRDATLGFCGIDVARVMRCAPVKDSSADKRSRWIQDAYLIGARLRTVPFSFRQRLARGAKAWLAALRLQFYPMTLIAYWLGALLAGNPDRAIDQKRFWFGYLFIFLLEAATVFSNDLIDRSSDKANRFWGPFSGGSRVLQDGRISASSLRNALSAALILCVILALWLTVSATGPLFTGLLLIASFVLTLGYTVPPLQLSYRALGEIDVAFTHSIFAIAAGAILQDSATLPANAWILGAPLFLAIIPAITLSAIPDHEADAAAGKATIAVRFGIRAAFIIAGLSAISSLIASFVADGLTNSAFFGLWFQIPVLLHLVWFIQRIAGEARQPAAARRIDGTMISGLSFIFWFCVWPVARLLSGV